MHGATSSSTDCCGTSADSTGPRAPGTSGRHAQALATVSDPHVASRIRTSLRRIGGAAFRPPLGFALGGRLLCRSLVSPQAHDQNVDDPGLVVPSIGDLGAERQPSLPDLEERRLTQLGSSNAGSVPGRPNLRRSGLSDITTAAGPKCALGCGLGAPPHRVGALRRTSRARQPVSAGMSRCARIRASRNASARRRDSG